MFLTSHSLLNLSWFYFFWRHTYMDSNHLKKSLYLSNFFGTAWRDWSSAAVPFQVPQVQLLLSIFALAYLNSHILILCTRVFISFLRIHIAFAYSFLFVSIYFYLGSVTTLSSVSKSSLIFSNLYTHLHTVYDLWLPKKLYIYKHSTNRLQEKRKRVRKLEWCVPGKLSEASLRVRPQLKETCASWSSCWSR